VILLSHGVDAQVTGPAPKSSQQQTVQQQQSVQNFTKAMRHLHSLGYWISAQDSIKNYPNKQAILAWQKVEGRKRSGVLRDSDFEAVMHATRPVAKDLMHRYHVEVDLDRQVLFTVDSLDRVAWIVPVSTGSGKYFETLDSTTGEMHGRYALTPRGNFKVYYRVAGWKKSQLGLLYDPLYVMGGIAIHGAKEVPAKPASHGCVRIPMFTADVLFRAVPMGTPVMIYGENPPRSRDYATTGKLGR
jgi:lipoprotein-anchoring transpeptidase ErfK/SrfK